MLIREERACELRIDDLTQSGKIYLIGRAASFGTRSSNLGSPSAPWYETLEPGCFDQALTTGNIACLVNHSVQRFLGDTEAGTCRVMADNSSLRYKTELALDTPEAQTVISHFRRGEVRSGSFAFAVNWEDPDAETWTQIIDDTGQPAMLRTIHKVSALFDVSVLVGATPAYPSGTTAALSDRALPPGMPAELRAALERSAAADDPDPDGDQIAGDQAELPLPCMCECDRCLMEGRCEECTLELCDDDACRDAGCPMQDPTDPDLDDDVEDLLDELEGDRAADHEDEELATLAAELELEELAW
jgi:HK97 family phage prohead protease